MKSIAAAQKHHPQAHLASPGALVPNSLGKGCEARAVCAAPCRRTQQDAGRSTGLSAPFLVFVQGAPSGFNVSLNGFQAPGFRVPCYSLIAL